MEIMVAKNDDHHQQSSPNTQEHLQEPLLPSSSQSDLTSPHVDNNKDQTPIDSSSPKPPKTRTQKAIRKTFKNTTRLTNLLPTGSVLAFEILSPAIRGNDDSKKCTTNMLRQIAAWALVIFCALSCFFACFIDSIRDSRGKVRYGFATWKGLWVVDGTVKLNPDEGEKYSIRAMDFVHGIMSILVFAAVVMINGSMVNCLLPETSAYTLTVLPVGIGVVCSCFIVWFPSKRHGVTNPLSSV